MLQKIVLVIKNQLLILSNEEVALKCLSSNILISSLAKKELVERELDDLKIDPTLLSKIVTKLSIDELWELAKKKESNLVSIAHKRLQEIFEYYKQINEKEYLDKVNEDIKDYFYLIKK